MAKIFQLNSDNHEDSSDRDEPNFFKDSADIALDLMDKGLNESIKILENEIKNSPQNYILYSLLSTVYLSNRKFEEAKTVIFKGIKLFPNKFVLHSHLAFIYIKNNENEKAEQTYKNALENFAEDEYIFKSECLNELALFYMKIGNMDEAIKNWKSSITAFPSNYNTLVNIVVFTPNYDEIKSISTSLNDILTFFDIHIDRYLSSKNKEDFDDTNEKETFCFLLIDVWEDDIIPRGDELNQFQPNEKIELFKNTEIDYDEHLYGDDEFDDDEFDDDEFDDDEHLKVENSIYSIVPLDDMELLVFVSPLLKQIGIKKERIDALFAKTVEPTDFEEYFTNWAIAVVQNLVEEFHHKKKKMKEKYNSAAFEIAIEELEEGEVKIAFEDIKELLDMVN